MTRPRDIEHVLDLWIGDGPFELPDRVLADALLEIDNTQQRGALAVPWRFTEMPTPVRLLLVAALAVVAAGAALVVGGAVRPRDDAPPPLVQTPPRGAGVTIGSDPAGIWALWRPTAFGLDAGVYTLTVPSDPGPLIAESADGRQISLGSVTVVAAATASLGPTDRCPRAGRYTYGVSDDGHTLTLMSNADSCIDRATLLEGGWARRLVDGQLEADERYRVVTHNALIDLTLPPDYRAIVTTEENPVSWLKLDDDSVSFIVLDGFAPLVDRCHVSDGLRPPLRTLDDFSAWIASNEGIEASAITETTVAGHPARVVDVAGGPGCDEPYGGMPFTFLSRGLHARDWAVDVGGTVLFLELVDDTPPHDPMTQALLGVGDALIDSMEISAP